MTAVLPPLSQTIDRDGFAVIPSILPFELVTELRRTLAEQLPEDHIAGVRALAAKVPIVQALSRSALLRTLIEPVVGPEARLIRSVLFTKRTTINWHAAWHQDLTIAVQRRIDMDGFVAWTEKDGAQHVQPPTAVLEQILTVRVHLDAADDTNGALWVAPGSHRCGRVVASDAAAMAEQLHNELCIVDAGDVVLMRPLLLHASHKASSHRPRRVIHLEFSGASLPPPLQWAEAA